MASQQKMNMNKHLRSQSGAPVETKSRMKRERKRENARKVQSNGASKEV